MSFYVNINGKINGLPHIIILVIQLLQQQQ